MEVVARHDGDTFRGVYAVRFETAIHVLHAFRKKSRRGITTPQQELDVVRRRLRPPSGTTVTRIGKTDATKVTDITVERGSGNVFADLGFPDADAHLVKAEFVSRIDDIVRDRGIIQTETSWLLGLSQPDVSRLLRGDFREYSLERLLRLLNALRRDIDIVIRQPSSPDDGRLHIATAEPARHPASRVDTGPNASSADSRSSARSAPTACAPQNGPSRTGIDGKTASVRKHWNGAASGMLAAARKALGAEHHAL